MAHKLPSGAPRPTFSNVDASAVVADTAIEEIARGLFGTHAHHHGLEAFHHPLLSDIETRLADVIDTIREVPPAQRAERAKQILDVMCGRAHEAMTEHFRLHYAPDLDKGDQDTGRAIIEIITWANGPLVLERPTGSAFHKLIEASAKAKIVAIGNRHQDVPRPIGPEVYGVFLVEHDWSAALKADTEGEVRWPYDTWVIEARISGKRVMALMSRPREDVPRIHPNNDYMLLFVETSFGWSLPTSYDLVGGRWVEVLGYTEETYLGFERVAKIMQEQVRAICIALDAAVIETEVIRAPHKLNHAREKAGKLPIRDHHILKLAHRHRALPGAPASDEKRRSPRLHFRRGHWRHYENAKVWINWMLVGDESLGWIDKEYRL